MAQLSDAERRALRLKARAATLEALRSLDGEARRNAIRERALADGGFTENELSAAPPEAAGDKFQHLVDHQLAWALTGLRRDGLVENPSRGVWRLCGAAVEPVEPLVEQPLATSRLEALSAMPYREYLRTPEWRRVRAAALLRAGNACSLDATHTEDLEVHHRTYDRRGRELPSDVIVLCRDCHRLHHRAFGRPGRATPSTPASVPPPASTRDAARTTSPSLSPLRRLLDRLAG